MAPLPCFDMAIFPSHTYYWHPLGVSALHSLFLYLGRPPSGWLRLFSSQTFSHINAPTISSLILPAYTAYEDGTECSETLAYKIQTPGNHPKERI